MLRTDVSELLVSTATTCSDKWSPPPPPFCSSLLSSSSPVPLSPPPTFLRPADSCSDLQPLSSASLHSIASVVCELIADQLTSAGLVCLLRRRVCDVYVSDSVLDVASPRTQVSSPFSAVRRFLSLLIQSSSFHVFPSLFSHPSAETRRKEACCQRLQFPSSPGAVCLRWRNSCETSWPTLRFVLRVDTRTSQKSHADKEVFDLVGAEGEGCYSLR